MVVSFTAETEKLEKTIYFLSLMSCPINKVLHVILTRYYGGGGGGGGAGGWGRRWWGALAPFSRALLL